MTGYPCCCQDVVDCDLCSGGWPISWTVEIAGITSESCTGGNCTDINGTYAIDDITDIESSSCQTSEAPISGVCGFTGISFTILQTGPELLVSMSAGGAEFLRWNKTVSSSPSCHNFANEELAFKEISGGFCPEAKVNGSTATVTAN